MRSLLPLALVLLSGCASLYHVQVGEIDNRLPSTPFEVAVSETTIDLDDVKRASSILLDQKSSREANDALSFVQMFQMGHRTGVPVYNHNYVDDLRARLLEACPTGRITGLTMIREAREYPVIKGEIVKIKGYCIKKG